MPTIIPLIASKEENIHALPGAATRRYSKKSFICFTSTKLMTALEFDLRVILIAKDAVLAINEANQLWYIIHRDGVNEPDVTEIVPTIQ